MELDRALARKTAVSLGLEASRSIKLRTSWFTDLNRLLEVSCLFLRVCWLKAIAGAWCTSVRLHTAIQWPCIFGCDARDELVHYLVCPILWQFARETLRLPEPSLLIEARLALVEPSIDKLRALAFVHTLYHSCRNDPGCVDPEGHICTPERVQYRASQLCRSVRCFVLND